MKIEIKGLKKLSVNQYNNLHWTQKKKFKDNLRWLVAASTPKHFKGGYNLSFHFYFKGRRLDTINVAHMVKIIEDYLFKQDKDNRQITINVSKGTENKCILELTKIEK